MPEFMLDLPPSMTGAQMASVSSYRQFNTQYSGNNSVKYRVEIKTYSWGQLYPATEAKQEDFILHLPRVVFLNQISTTHFVIFLGKSTLEGFPVF